jgi:hypothetical protein
MDATPLGTAMGREVRASDITLDPEFRELLPRSAPDEQRALEEVLLRDGCREPLIVWPCAGRLLLLASYEQFPTLKQHRLPFRVVEQPLATRDEAELYIIKYQLAKKNLTTLGASYLRGLRYRAEKRPHGGDRSSAPARLTARQLRTAEALAAEFHVSAATIQRDGEFAAAVNAVAAICGEDVKPWILARGAKLTCGMVLGLAEMEPEEQRAVVAVLQENGRMPRSWRNHGRPATITLPSEPVELARELVRKRGRAWAEAVAAALISVLGGGDGQPSTGPAPGVFWGKMG